MSARRAVAIAATWALAALCTRVEAGVSGQEAARLRTDLTPLGAEKAGNAQGTIPAWNGGYTVRWPGYESGQRRPDPFAEDKPLFRITAANVEQYADRLSDGVKELLRRFPDYRIDVYPTHRTGAAPQWVYDNTFANATRARTRNDGLTVEGAFGGIPFPIPASGREAMWNHLLAWKGEAVVEDGGIYLASGGSAVLTAQRRADLQYPYYYRDGSPDRYAGFYYLARFLMIRPPGIAGTAYVIREPTDPLKRETETWAYLVGQRRVRPVPTLVYDFPDDGWDARGRLWKVAHALPLLVPELPALVTFPDVVYDLSSGRYAARYLLNESRIHYQVVPRRSEDYFSPAALVGEGVR